MSNPSKKKGTGGETEFARASDAHGIKLRRTSEGSRYDFDRVVRDTETAEVFEPINALATRPDRGRWLVTIPAEDFWYLLRAFPNRRSHVEVKRFKRFLHHAIFEEKFGGNRSAR